MQDRIEDLRGRLERYPAERFPVQHATTRFHLGVTLAEAGRYREAEEALVTAARIFADDLPVEHAKSLNALGSVLRATGRLDQAARAFSHALERFEEAGRTLEGGAARFNLGLVLRQAGDDRSALDAFRRARHAFDPKLAPAQVAAAAREEGATLMALERPEEALPLLEEAVELAARAGDQAGAGAVANLLGLALLATDRAAEAVASFERAAAAHPKTLRGEAHAMAKANLALAHLRTGSPRPARLAARQARDAPESSPPIRRLAARVLAEVGSEPGGLAALLAGEPPGRRGRIVRDELARWLDLDEAGRRAEAACWVREATERPEPATDLLEAWLGGILELPPEPMETVIRDALEALAGQEAEVRSAFATHASRAMARFHVPQMMRLKDSFARIAGEVGVEARW